MKEIESNNFTYTQKDIMVGNRKRNIIIIDKKPGVNLGENKISNTTSSKNKTVTIRKKRCGGCGRRRKG